MKTKTIKEKKSVIPEPKVIGKVSIKPYKNLVEPYKSLIEL